MKKIHYIIFALVMLISMKTAFSDVDVDIKGDIFNKYPAAKQGDLMRIKVDITNEGTERMNGLRCEIGFYARSQVESWGFAIAGPGIKNVPNCIPTQTNVDTVVIDLDVNQKKTVGFELYAPYTDAARAYVLFSECFNNCYNVVGDDIIIYGHDKVNIDLQNIVPDYIENTCIDGIENQDETDTDCGGSCPDCINGLKCNLDKDCKSTFCKDGRCRPCEPDWVCNDWSVCKEDGYKYRSCDDNRHCGSASKAPIKELCKDGAEPDIDFSLIIMGVVVVVIIIGIAVMLSRRK